MVYENMLINQTYRQLQDFIKQRLFPEFESGYYKSLIKNPKEMTQNMMKIRDSSLVFRTSSQGSSMEGLQVDFLSLDEYDREVQIFKRS